MFSLQSPVYVPFSSEDLDPSDARSSVFTELHSLYHLPLQDTSLITDILASPSTSDDASDSSNITNNDDTIIVKNSGKPVTQPSVMAGTNLGLLRDPFGTTKLQDVVFVASVAPLTLHVIQPSKSLTRPLVSMSLHSVLPTLGGSHQPRLRLWKGVGDMVGLYEELTNTVMLADPANGEVLRLNKSSFLERVALPLRQLMQQEVQNRCSPSGQAILVYSRKQPHLTVVDPSKGKVDNLELDVDVENVISDGRGGWIIQDTEGGQWILGGSRGLDSVVKLQLEDSGRVEYFGDVEGNIMRGALQDMSGVSTSPAESTTGGGILTTKNTYATLLQGYNESNSSGGLYSWPRIEPPKESDTLGYPYHWQQQAIVQPVPPETGRSGVVIPLTGQVVKAIKKLPDQAPDLLRTVPCAGYLEVTDVGDRSVSWLPVPPARHLSEYWQWSVGRIAPHLLVSGGGSGGVVTVDKSGGVRVWQVGGEVLKQGMEEWAAMVGDEDQTKRLELSKSWGDMSLNAPKHGKMDEKNAPHVGGNTWAGGTGGRDTAGLGGVGGPYRLDAGHDVHQVSDEVKATVPPEVTEAARKMAKAAHQKRLKEIQMSEYDHEQYQALSNNVTAQVTQMRAILSSLTAKAGERWWVTHRPDGELDDNALVDGLAGATNIYRQRQEIPPEAGQPQTKPKRLRLLLDASGSMYRFNGHDKRLQRSLEAALMLMEACLGHEARLKYDIYAHSGEDHSVRLCTVDTVPDDSKKRLDLLRTVLAHSQFCMSGDSTVTATTHACDQLAKIADQSDQSFVVLLSDANLDRYGISPNRLAAAMTSQDSVQCYAVFIGSLGNQATRLAEALPAGKAYVCLDVNDLPQIMQHIFTHAMTQ